MKNVMKRGFTLIELLVVIAIIGILAAVVLGSLNDARDGAQDASAKGSMNSLRNQAELYYNSNGFEYDTDDTNNATPNGVCGDGEITALLAAAGDTTDCNESDDAYAAVVTLTDGSFFCVDSTGYSGSEALGAAELSCE